MSSNQTYEINCFWTWKKFFDVVSSTHIMIKQTNYRIKNIHILRKDTQEKEEKIVLPTNLMCKLWSVKMFSD